VPLLLTHIHSVCLCSHSPALIRIFPSHPPLFTLAAVAAGAAGAAIACPHLSVFTAVAAIMLLLL